MKILKRNSWYLFELLYEKCHLLERQISVFYFFPVEQACVLSLYWTSLYAASLLNRFPISCVEVHLSCSYICIKIFNGNYYKLIYFIIFLSIAGCKIMCTTLFQSKIISTLKKYPLPPSVKWFVLILCQIYNREFWEEVIACFPLIRHVEFDASNNSSIVACVAAATFLPSHLLAKIRGYTYRHRIYEIRYWEGLRCLDIHITFHKHWFRDSESLWGDSQIHRQADSTAI
jgi:hypothetical protein